MTRRFQKLAIATTISTYLVIFAGAFVRASGAGMGCPDWPRCFDRWIPPTDPSQVPRHLSQYFNLRLAWTEYVNRLIGATTGILALATLAIALRAYRHAPRVLGSSLGAFVCMGLAGWLGKRVVEKNLDPSFVTVHMLVALATVSFLIDATVCSFFAPPAASERQHITHELPSTRRTLSVASLGVIGALLVQIALGTRVRASIEQVANNTPTLTRAHWLEHIGPVDGIHRTTALLVLALTTALAVYTHRRVDPHPVLRRLSTAIAIASAAQIAIGIGLAYGGLPPPLQIVHLVLASLLLGALVVLTLLARRLPTAGVTNASTPPAQPPIADIARTVSPHG